VGGVNTMGHRRTGRNFTSIFHLRFTSESAQKRLSICWNRERDRQRERERDRQRERERDRQRERETDREKERETDRERDRQRERQTERETDGERDRQRERKRDRRKRAHVIVMALFLSDHSERMNSDHQTLMRN